jgi:hypothetical protein
LAGLTVEGENSDGGDRKCARYYGGSVAGVDEMCAHLTVGGGERESLAARSEQRVAGAREKNSAGDGGGALLKWCGGEATEGEGVRR